MASSQTSILAVNLACYIQQGIFRHFKKSFILFYCFGPCENLMRKLIPFRYLYVKYESAARVWLRGTRGLGGTAPGHQNFNVPPAASPKKEVSSEVLEVKNPINILQKGF